MVTRPAIRRILYATDFMESSRLALDFAVAFARHFHAAITILHAVELQSPAREAEVLKSQPCVSRVAAIERVEAMARGVRLRGLEVETSVEDGIPSEVILRAVGVHSADLLVLGIHGVHRGLEHLLIGSNTENILLSASCPTMTVGAHVLGGVDPGLHFKEILYFSDFTPEATAAAPYADFLGKEFHAAVDVCQLIPAIAEYNPKLRRLLAEQYCETIKQVLPDATSAWTMPSFHLDRGMAIDQIIERARTQNAGVIVLGVHTQTQLGHHLHTSFAYQLLAHATCPVITIPHGLGAAKSPTGQGGATA